MEDQPKKSPFSRLDTSLLRSTRDIPIDAEPVPSQVEPAAKPAPRPARQRKPVPDKANVTVSTKDSQNAIPQASELARYPDEMIAAVRKIVRVTGREVSFIRLTSAEKEQLTDIVYTLKKQGKKTTETEINRIAVNLILEDYRANGTNSILVKVIDSLLA